MTTQRKEAVDLLDAMIKRIQDARNEDTAADWKFSLAGAARMAYNLNAITFDEWLAYLAKADQTEEHQFPLFAE